MNPLNFGSLADIIARINQQAAHPPATPAPQAPQPAAPQAPAGLEGIIAGINQQAKMPSLDEFISTSLKQGLAAGMTTDDQILEAIGAKAPTEYTSNWDYFKNQMTSPDTDLATKFFTAVGMGGRAAAVEIAKATGRPEQDSLMAQAIDATVKNKTNFGGDGLFEVPQGYRDAVQGTLGKVPIVGGFLSGLLTPEVLPNPLEAGAFLENYGLPTLAGIAGGLGDAALDPTSYLGFGAGRTGRAVEDVLLRQSPESFKNLKVVGQQSFNDWVQRAPHLTESSAREIAAPILIDKRMQDMFTEAVGAQARLVTDMAIAQKMGNTADVARIQAQIDGIETNLNALAELNEAYMGPQKDAFATLLEKYRADEATQQMQPIKMPKFSIAEPTYEQVSKTILPEALMDPSVALDQRLEQLAQHRAAFEAQIARDLPATRFLDQPLFIGKGNPLANSAGYLGSPFHWAWTKALGALRGDFKEIRSALTPLDQIGLTGDADEFAPPPIDPLAEAVNPSAGPTPPGTTPPVAGTTPPGTPVVPPGGAAVVPPTAGTAGGASATPTAPTGPSGASPWAGVNQQGFAGIPKELILEHLDNAIDGINRIGKLSTTDASDLKIFERYKKRVEKAKTPEDLAKIKMPTSKRTQAIFDEPLGLARKRLAEGWTPSENLTLHPDLQSFFDEEMESWMNSQDGPGHDPRIQSGLEDTLAWRKRLESGKFKTWDALPEREQNAFYEYVGRLKHRDPKAGLDDEAAVAPLSAEEVAQVYNSWFAQQPPAAAAKPVPGGATEELLVGGPPSPEQIAISNAAKTGSQAAATSILGPKIYTTLRGKIFAGQKAPHFENFAKTLIKEVEEQKLGLTEGQLIAYVRQQRVHADALKVRGIIKDADEYFNVTFQKRNPDITPLGKPRTTVSSGSYSPMDAATKRGIIELFDGADLSTLVHESHHHLYGWLDEADRAVIENWAKDAGLNAKEAWAVGMEQLLRDGKITLARESKSFDRVTDIFLGIRDFLVNIYKSFTDAEAASYWGHVPQLTDEVVDVFRKYSDPDGEVGKVADVPNAGTGAEDPTAGKPEETITPPVEDGTTGTGGAARAIDPTDRGFGGAQFRPPDTRPLWMADPKQGILDPATRFQESAAGFSEDMLRDLRGANIKFNSPEEIYNLGRAAIKDAFKRLFGEELDLSTTVERKRKGVVENVKKDAPREDYAAELIHRLDLERARDAGELDLEKAVADGLVDTQFAEGLRTATPRKRAGVKNPSGALAVGQQYWVSDVSGKKALLLPLTKVHGGNAHFEVSKARVEKRPGGGILSIQGETWQIPMDKMKARLAEGEALENARILAKIDADLERSRKEVERALAPDTSEGGNSADASVEPDDANAGGDGRTPLSPLEEGEAGRKDQIEAIPVEERIATLLDERGKAVEAYRSKIAEYEAELEISPDKKRIAFYLKTEREDFADFLTKQGLDPKVDMEALEAEIYARKFAAPVEERVGKVLDEHMDRVDRFVDNRTRVYDELQDAIQKGEASEEELAELRKMLVGLDTDLRSFMRERGVDMDADLDYLLEEYGRRDAARRGEGPEEGRGEEEGRVEEEEEVRVEEEEGPPTPPEWLYSDKPEYMEVLEEADSDSLDLGIEDQVDERLLELTSEWFEGLGSGSVLKKIRNAGGDATGLVTEGELDDAAEAAERWVEGLGSRGDVVDALIRAKQITAEDLGRDLAALYRAEWESAHGRPGVEAPRAPEAPRTPETGKPETGKPTILDLTQTKEMLQEYRDILKAFEKTKDVEPEAAARALEIEKQLKGLREDLPLEDLDLFRQDPDIGRYVKPLYKDAWDRNADDPGFRQRLKSVLGLKKNIKAEDLGGPGLLQEVPLSRIEEVLSAYDAKELLADVRWEVGLGLYIEPGTTRAASQINGLVEAAGRKRTGTPETGKPGEETSFADKLLDEKEREFSARDNAGEALRLRFLETEVDGSRPLQFLPGGTVMAYGRGKDAQSTIVNLGSVAKEGSRWTATRKRLDGVVETLPTTKKTRDLAGKWLMEQFLEEQEDLKEGIIGPKAGVKEPSATADQPRTPKEQFQTTQALWKNHKQIVESLDEETLDQPARTVDPSGEDAKALSTHLEAIQEFSENPDYTTWGKLLDEHIDPAADAFVRLYGTEVFNDLAGSYRDPEPRAKAMLDYHNEALSRSSEMEAGAKFLKDRYELHAAKEVQSAAVEAKKSYGKKVPAKPVPQIVNYLEMLEEFDRTDRVLNEGSVDDGTSFYPKETWKALKEVDYVKDGFSRVDAEDSVRRWGYEMGLRWQDYRRGRLRELMKEHQDAVRGPWDDLDESVKDVVRGEVERDDWGYDYDSEDISLNAQAEERWDSAFDGTKLDWILHARDQYLPSDVYFDATYDVYADTVDDWRAMSPANKPDWSQPAVVSGNAAVHQFFDWAKQRIIKEENIPESYWELQRRLVREQGHGNVDITPEQKKRLADNIIKSQEQSLDTWINYVSSTDAPYPTWFKYYALREVLSLGDLKDGVFLRRTAGTVKPFAALSPSALDMVYQAMRHKYVDGSGDFGAIGLYRVTSDSPFAPTMERVNLLRLEKGLEESKMPKFGEMFSFSDLYAKALQREKDSAIAEGGAVAGKWVRYPRGSDARPLYESLQPEVAGLNTEWCTAGSLDTAQMHVDGGDFYVYYSLPMRPRIAIRMEGDKIAEVRGVLKGQNMEGEVADIADAKLESFPDGPAYKERLHDTKILTTIDAKSQRVSAAMESVNAGRQAVVSKAVRDINTATKPVHVRLAIGDLYGDDAVEVLYGSFGDDYLADGASLEEWKHGGLDLIRKRDAALVDRKTPTLEEMGVEDLTVDELRFLYEVDQPIKWMGHWKDPRIDEILARRDSWQDMITILGVPEESVVFRNMGDLRPITPDVKAYVGPLDMDVLKAVQEGTLDPDKVYREFPTDKLKIGELAKYTTVSDAARRAVGYSGISGGSRNMPDTLRFSMFSSTPHRGKVDFREVFRPVPVSYLPAVVDYLVRTLPENTYSSKSYYVATPHADVVVNIRPSTQYSGDVITVRQVSHVPYVDGYVWQLPYAKSYAVTEPAPAGSWRRGSQWRDLADESYDQPRIPRAKHLERMREDMEALRTNTPPPDRTDLRPDPTAPLPAAPKPAQQRLEWFAKHALDMDPKKSIKDHLELRLIEEQVGIKSNDGKVRGQLMTGDALHQWTKRFLETFHPENRADVLSGLQTAYKAILKGYEEEGLKTKAPYKAQAKTGPDVLKSALQVFEDLKDGKKDKTQKFWKRVTSSPATGLTPRDQKLRGIIKIQENIQDRIAKADFEIRDLAAKKNIPAMIDKIANLFDGKGKDGVVIFEQANALMDGIREMLDTNGPWEHSREWLRRMNDVRGLVAATSQKSADLINFVNKTLIEEAPEMDGLQMMYNLDTAALDRFVKEWAETVTESKKALDAAEEAKVAADPSYTPIHPDDMAKQANTSAAAKVKQSIIRELDARLAANMFGEPDAAARVARMKAYLNTLSDDQVGHLAGAMKTLANARSDNQLRAAVERHMGADMEKYMAQATDAVRNIRQRYVIPGEQEWAQYRAVLDPTERYVFYRKHIADHVDRILGSVLRHYGIDHRAIDRTEQWESEILAAKRDAVHRIFKDLVHGDLPALLSKYKVRLDESVYGATLDKVDRGWMLVEGYKSGLKSPDAEVQAVAKTRVDEGMVLLREVFGRNDAAIAAFNKELGDLVHQKYTWPLFEAERRAGLPISYRQEYIPVALRGSYDDVSKLIDKSDHGIREGKKPSLASPWVSAVERRNFRNAAELEVHLNKEKAHRDTNVQRTPKVEINNSLVATMIQRRHLHNKALVNAQYLSDLKQLLPNELMPFVRNTEKLRNAKKAEGWMDMGELAPQMTGWMVSKPMHDYLKSYMRGGGVFGEELEHFGSVFTRGMMAVMRPLKHFNVSLDLVHLKNIAMLGLVSNIDWVKAKNNLKIAMDARKKFKPVKMARGQFERWASPFSPLADMLEEHPLFERAVRAGLFPYGGLEVGMSLDKQVDVRMGRIPAHKAWLDGEAAPPNRLTFDLVDRAMRLALFEQYLEAGLPAREAAKQANHFLLDYSMRWMEPGTREWLYSFFPFAAWTVGNLKLHGGNIVQNPRWYMMLNRFQEDMNNEFSGVPGYAMTPALASSFATPFFGYQPKEVGGGISEAILPERMHPMSADGQLHVKMQAPWQGPATLAKGVIDALNPLDRGGFQPHVAGIEAARWAVNRTWAPYQWAAGSVAPGVVDRAKDQTFLQQAFGKDRQHAGVFQDSIAWGVGGIMEPLYREMIYPFISKEAWTHGAPFPKETLSNFLIRVQGLQPNAKFRE